MMSVGFLLSSPSDAVIWRGPKKNGQLAVDREGMRGDVKDGDSSNLPYPMPATNDLRTFASGLFDVG